MGMPRARVSAALARVESHADLFKNYQRLRAQHIAALSGIVDVRPWDWSLPEMVDDCMNILKRRVDELAAAYGNIRAHAH
jgi:hypothetical protein